MSKRLDYEDEDEVKYNPQNKKEVKRMRKLGEARFAKEKKKESIRDARRRKDSIRYSNYKTNDYDD